MNEEFQVSREKKKDQEREEKNVQNVETDVKVSLLILSLSFIVGGGEVGRRGR